MSLFERKEEDWCSGPVLGKMVRFAVPLMLTGLLQLLFNAADLVVVGRFAGSSSVGAVGATGSLTNLLVNLFMGLSVGSGVAAARAIGAKNEREQRNIVHTSILVAAIGGVFLALVGVFYSGFFLELMATPEDVLPLSTVYMRIFFCGMPFNLLYNYGASILRATGDSRSPLRYLTVAGVLNVVLNLIFVILFHMDVAGVALATALTQGLSAVLVLRNLCTRQDGCRLDLRHLFIRGKTLGYILRIGIPAGLQGMMYSISNVIIQSSVNSFGSDAVSGNAAAGNLEGFVWTTMNSFAVAVMNFAGQNMGAGRVDRMKKVARAGLLGVFADGLVLGNLLYLFSKPLLGIYITDSPEAIAAGQARITCVCILYFLCGMADVSTYLLRGMGYSLLPMIISVAGICGFRLLWIFTVFKLPEYHSLLGLMTSYPISWLLALSVNLIFFAVLLKKALKKAGTLFS